jgi:hypothetical protein
MSVVNEIERDDDAVRAGVTHRWNQGPVERAVNKIKTNLLKDYLLLLRKARKDGVPATWNWFEQTRSDKLDEIQTRTTSKQRL